MFRMSLDAEDPQLKIDSGFGTCRESIASANISFGSEIQTNSLPGFGWRRGPRRVFWRVAGVESDLQIGQIDSLPMARGENPFERSAR
jgi:hypothetical protein